MSAILMMHHTHSCTHTHTHTQDLLSPSQPPPTNWDSEHYSTAVALYHSLGKKASGKPAARVEPSHVGSLIIAR